MPPIPRAGHVCRPACAGRRDAMTRAEFCYHWTLRGWCFTDAQKPSRPDGSPYLWYECPWCGADLPDPVDGVIKALEEGDAA